MEKVSKKIDSTIENYTQKIKEILNFNSILLSSHIRSQYLVGGTSDTKLRKRTGKLSASTHPIKASKTTEGFIAGVKFGTVYAGVHIGRKGTITTIQPKNKKYLAIPLSGALTKSGVSRGGPEQEDIFGETFIKKSKKGNLIIFGKMKYQKGSKMGETHGNIIPLFVLKKQVKIKTRVAVEDLIRWIKPKIINDIIKIKAV